MTTRDHDFDPDRAHPRQILSWALERFAGWRVAATTGFGMEGCALLDLLAELDADVRVLWIDTGFLFDETIALRESLGARYPRLRFERLRPAVTVDAQAARYGDRLWTRDPATCCAIRKVAPLTEALVDVDLWITGLRRDQALTRADTPVVGWDWQYELLKLNPLATWTRREVWEYVRERDVPHNPLHHRGFPSIGCTPCTRPVSGSAAGDYSRDGRFAGQGRTECGLHGGRRPSAGGER